MTADLAILAAKATRDRRRQETMGRGLTEQVLHETIVEHLERRLMPGAMFWHVPNGGFRLQTEAAKLKRMGVKPGVSDLNGIVPAEFNCGMHSYFWVLELKRLGERPTADQMIFLQQIERSGNLAAWADTLDRALELLESWGVIRPDRGRQ